MNALAMKFTMKRFSHAPFTLLLAAVVAGELSAFF
jgi:hypothetical protein